MLGVALDPGAAEYIHVPTGMGDGALTQSQISIRLLATADVVGGRYE